MAATYYRGKDAEAWRKLMKKYGLRLGGKLTDAEKDSLLKMENNPSFIPNNLERLRKPPPASRARGQNQGGKGSSTVVSSRAPSKPKPKPQPPTPAAPLKVDRVLEEAVTKLKNQPAKPVDESPKAVNEKPPAEFKDRPDALDIPPPKGSKPKDKKKTKELKTSLAAARKAGDTYYMKNGKKMAAVTKEDLKKSGLSLRDYLNRKEGLTRRERSTPPKPKPNPKMMGGGMAGKKPRMGHMDYRKGGMMYKTTRG